MLKQWSKSYASLSITPNSPHPCNSATLIEKSLPCRRRRRLLHPDRRPFQPLTTAAASLMSLSPPLLAHLPHDWPPQIPRPLWIPPPRLWIPLPSDPRKKKLLLYPSLLSIVSNQVLPDKNTISLYLYSGHSPGSHCKTPWAHCVRL